MTDFNTSNVTIQLFFPIKSVILFIISIHLMLLFNKERVTDVNGTQDFNTSNVTIQPDPRSAFKTPISISIHLMLLFNLPKLVLPAIAGISIHLMLLFNCVRYYCIYKSFNISIHLMLLFNVSLSFHCMCNNHFNTSNVTIQLIIIDSTTCTYLHFNTSNVTIQQSIYDSSKICN